jgi:hypothetical protein
VDDDSAQVAYRRVVDELRADPAVLETKMMGMPSLKAGGKLFAGLRAESLLVKLGADRVSALIEAGRGEPFDPSGRGRPMKDWMTAALPDDDWLALAQEALQTTR